MSTILFVGHEASLTGAPFTQLYLIQWLRANTQYSIDLILLRGGPLEKEFEKVSNVYILSDYISSPTISQRITRKLSAILNYRIKNILNSVAKNKPHLIFANTALTIEFAIQLKQIIKVPVILNVHELETIFFSRSKEKFAEYAKELDFFIPGSQAVKSFYKSFCNIHENRMQIVYDFTNVKPVGESTSAEVRSRYGIPLTAKIVGSIGSLGWRKGPDLFLQIAQKYKSNNNIYFIWVGGDVESTAYKEILHDIHFMGLSAHVLFVGNQTDLRGFYEAFDVFLLTAREDPFPLVCLEAGLLGCPVICFENAGGMPEFVREDAGFAVPYSDIEAMSEKTSYLLENSSVRDQMGKVAQHRAENHHTIKNIGPEMYEIMKRFIS